MLSKADMYKSLFTENTVATQKHSSASINTNKIQYKIQRSSPSQYSWRTEPKNKKWKKTTKKYKTNMLRSIGKQAGESVKSVLRRKRKLRWEGFADEVLSMEWKSRSWPVAHSVTGSICSGQFSSVRLHDVNKPLFVNPCMVLAVMPLRTCVGGIRCTECSLVLFYSDSCCGH